MPVNDCQLDAQLGAIFKILRALIPEVEKQLEMLANSRAPTVAPWHYNVLRALASEMFNAIERLAQRSPDTLATLPVVAFNSRSCLELRVWAEFCCRSQANARSFFEDMWLDGEDIHAALAKLIAVREPSEANSIQSDLDRLSRTLRTTRTACRMVTLRKSRIKVSNAAREVGLGELFSSANRLMSKFGHPTAFAVFSSIKEVSRIAWLFRIIGAESCQSGLIAIKESACVLSRQPAAPGHG